MLTVLVQAGYSVTPNAGLNKISASLIARVAAVARAIIVLASPYTFVQGLFSNAQLVTLLFNSWSMTHSPLLF